MIRRLILEIPFTRSSVFSWEHLPAIRGGGYQVLCSGRPVVHCDTEEEARDQADDYNGEVVRQALRPMQVAPVVLAGESLRQQAQKDIADLWGG